MRIYIKGFKSIAEGQYVAIGKKLTFLVGPNSAGKSVVYHALSKLEQGNQLFGLDASSLHYNGTTGLCVLQQSLGVEWNDGNDVLESRVSYLVADEDDESPAFNLRNQNAQAYSKNIDLEGKTTSSTNLLKIKNSVVEHERIFNTENKGIVRTKKESLASSWMGHSFANRHNFEAFNKSDDLTGVVVKKAYEFLILTPIPQEEINNEKSIAYWFYKGLLENYSLGFFVWDPFEIRYLIIEKFFSGTQRQNLLNQFFHHDAAIKRRVEKFSNEYSVSNPLKDLRLVLVSADRVLPTQNDVQCVIAETVPKNIFHTLARSFVERDWGFDFSYGLISREHQRLLGTRGQLANRVNEALSNDLFIDNGYQINVQSSLILPRIQVQSFVEEEGTVVGGYFNASIKLQDSHGRTLGFDQVGSGIGYVLPVLVETLNPLNAGAMVFLQQPELHLHPALQASLSDVLIDAASDKKIVIETHSEHMILRTLKRIRQTFNENLIDKNLHLTYEDVAVNYFEPQGDGTTKVHIIRVAPDGEFIDRWPNGFFAERDQELFDE